MIEIDHSIFRWFYNVDLGSSKFDKVSSCSGFEAVNTTPPRCQNDRDLGCASEMCAVKCIGCQLHWDRGWQREREGGMQINTRIYYMRIISLMRLRSSMRMIGAACKLLSCQCSGQGPKMGWGIITPNFMAMLKGKMTFHARGLGSFTILTHLNCHSNDNGEITFRYSVINTPRWFNIAMDMDIAHLVRWCNDVWWCLPFLTWWFSSLLPSVTGGYYCNHSEAHPRGHVWTHLALGETAKGLRRRR